MPTGYTEKVSKGEIISLKDYATLCARAFLVVMRDSSMNTPFPDKLDETTPAYITEAIEGAKLRIAELTSMTWHEADVAAQADYEAQVYDYAVSIAERDKIKERYLAMLDKVHAWATEPTPEGLHDFMIAQLVDSLGYDCSDRPDETPERVPHAEWMADALSDAQHTLNYYTQRRDDEKAKVDEANAWLKVLHTSLEGIA